MRVPQTYNNKSLIHLWAYEDQDGKLLGAVARYEKTGEKKDVVPFFKSDGNGGFSAGIDITPRPLFGLYKLAKTKPFLSLKVKNARVHYKVWVSVQSPHKVVLTRQIKQTGHP